MNDYIQSIANKKLDSQAEILQDVLSKFSEKYTLKLFLNELEGSIKILYDETLQKLTDSDIINLKSFYQNHSIPFPIIKLSKDEYNYIKHFIRKVENLNFISCVENIGSEKNIYIEVINLNEMLFTDYLMVDFEYGISVKKEMDEVRTLVSLKKGIEEYLENLLIHLNTPAPQPIVKQKPELKIDQIALKYAYEGLQITRENGNEIAKEYGHNSGEKLFQRFTYFSSSANRKGKPNLCTPKKLDNKIKLIESIIELLPTDKQERAKDEVSILKKIYEAEYQ